MHTDRHLADRRNAILRILRGARVRRQEDLVDLLKADGFEVTQSSVSRDMRELGVLDREAVVVHVGPRYEPEGRSEPVAHTHRGPEHVPEIVGVLDAEPRRRAAAARPGVRAWPREGLDSG